jgi:superfamily II DNA/RNA helicase
MTFFGERARPLPPSPPTDTALRNSVAHRTMPERHLLTTMTFGALGVPQPLVDALTRDGVITPFPIQTDTLRDTLTGRDVLGRARTGSGKTLAFALPMIARIGAARGRSAPGRPRGLVLAPTRELATQINAVIAPLAKIYGLTSTTIFGGVPQGRQVSALKAGVDIIVACPGRLEDLMKQRVVALSAVEITVLDEADHMADLGFLPGVTRIMATTPVTGQRLLFSATLDNGVDKIVRQFLNSPQEHSVDESNTPIAAMTHHVFHLDGVEAKKEMIAALASGTGRRILFMRTKHHAKKLAKELTARGIPAVDLQGNLAQAKRDKNLAAFSGGNTRVLVATDVAARGVHVDDVELVVHVDPPTEHKAYLHRSGRTARAGSAGDVVTLVLPEQRRDTSDMMRKAAITVQPLRVHAKSPEVIALIGEVAEYVTPGPVEAEPVRQPRTGRSGRGGSDNRGAIASGGRGRGTGQNRGTGHGNGAAPGRSSQGGARRGAAAGSTGGAAAFSARRGTGRSRGQGRG